MALKTSLLIFFSLLILPFALMAQEETPGLNIGDTIPSIGTLKNTEGQNVSFSEISGDKGLIIVFIRSADWCPYCQRQLVKLEDISENLSEKGYRMASVSYDDSEILARFKNKNGISYMLLSDEGSHVIRDFGVINEDIQPGTRFYGIPHPVIYIVNEEGIVQAKLHEAGYKNRPETEEILEAISALNAQ